MRSILLFSGDERLLRTIAAACDVGEEVLRLEPRPPALVFHQPVHRILVVLDCRGKPWLSIEQDVLYYRNRNSADFRCVALTSTIPSATVPQPSTRRVEVIGARAAKDLDVLVLADDMVAITLRALLNDVDGSTGTAFALEALRKVLAPAATRLAECVLASGCRVDSVGRAAAALGLSRGAVASALDREGSPSPKAILALARAAYAAVLITKPSMSMASVADRLRLSAGRYVHEHLQDAFQLGAEEIRDRAGSRHASDFLPELLDGWCSRTSEVGKLPHRADLSSVDPKGA